MSVAIKFCGAAGTVTGSCYWVRTDACQFLVDCGMFQGSKTIKSLNYDPFPFDPAQIDFVLVTHAHTDHAGLLPKLTKHGFKGSIYTTEGTRDLLAYMLPDSAYIQEMEVKRLNRRNQQRGKSSVDPIYSGEDVDDCLGQIRPVDYANWVDIGQIKARFWNAGHILGAASIEIIIDETASGGASMSLLFSGDIGPDHKAFHPDPDAPTEVDFLICEATYGGRLRPEVRPDERRALLAKEINDAMRAGGALVIPAFAVERTQELLLDLSHLLQSRDVPNVSVFLDSPLAIKVTSVFSAHAGDLEDVASKTAPFGHASFHFTETTGESKSIARFSSGLIIVAASGMCDAGRIRHHLKNHLWRAQSTILLVGYQAEGTLGRLLEQGKKMVKIQGEEIEVKARIRSLDTYSGHADSEGLLDWVAARMPVKRSIFLTHGSETALSAMRNDLVSRGVPDEQLLIPRLDDDYDLLQETAAIRRKTVVRRLRPEVVDKPDWHNELAQLTLDMRAGLEAAASDTAREKMLQTVSRAFRKASRNRRPEKN